MRDHGQVGKSINLLAQIALIANSNGITLASFDGSGHVLMPGFVNAHVRLEGPTDGLIREVLITGDFFVTPPRIVFDLEAALAGARIQEVDAIVKRFFEESAIEMLSVSPEDFTAAIDDALGKREGAW